MIVAIVIAPGKASGVGRALASLHRQTRPPERVLVAACPPSDEAEAAARRSGAEVLEAVDAGEGRAGVLNRALAELELDGADHVLVLDAGTEIVPEFVERALEQMREPRVGAVFAVPHGTDPQGWLQLVQQLERTRCAGELRRTGGPVVVPGAATLVRWRALQDVQWIHGRHYEQNAATEDVRLAVDLRTAGWEIRSPSGCRSVTELVPSVPGLLRQRRRWYLGALQGVTACGLSRVSAPCWHRRPGPGVSPLLLVLCLFLGTAALVAGWAGPVPLWLAAGLLLVGERVATVWEAGPRARLTAALVLPELLYALLLLVAFLAALRGHAVRGAEARPVVPVGAAGRRG